MCGEEVPSVGFSHGVSITEKEAHDWPTGPAKREKDSFVFIMVVPECCVKLRHERVETSEPFILLIVLT